MSGTGFLIGSAADLEASSGFPEASTGVYLCANEESAKECAKAGKNHLLLDEKPLESTFRQLNTLAYQLTFRVLQGLGPDHAQRDVLEANFTQVKAVLLQCLKTYLVLGHHFRSRPLDKLYVFDGPYPLTSLIVRGAARLILPGVEVVPQAGKAPAPNNHSLRGALRRVLGVCVNLRTRLIVAILRSTGVSFVVLSGALMHLAPVVGELRKRSRHALLWCETDFNMEKMAFCRRNRCLFMIVPPPVSNSRPHAADTDYFTAPERVQGADLSGLFNEALRLAVSTGVIRDAFDPARLKALLQLLHPRTILLDEDYSARRLFLVLARRAGTECIVLSHGTPANALEAPSVETAGKYASSLTMVNSEFEKEAYVGLYYDESRILVTGVPRYDEVYELSRQPAAPATPKAVLYGGSALVDFDFRQPYTLMGCKDFLAESAIGYLRDLMEACGDLSGVRLTVKPHYSDEDRWERCVEAAGKRADVQVLSHRSSIFRLERSADVVVTPESSLICEAIMLGKPVIVLNYGGELAIPYGETQLVLVARDKASLRAALQKALFDEEYLRALSSRREQLLKRFAGEFDGRNAERAVSRIIDATSREAA